MERISVYWDEDTNPANPGYVLRYWDGGQENTVPLTASTRQDAQIEALAYLGIDEAEISGYGGFHQD